MTLGEPKPGDAASLIRALTDKNVELFTIMPGEGNPTHVGSNVIALPLALDGGEAVNEAILVLNAGSSSIKFAAFVGREPDRSAGLPISSGDDPDKKADVAKAQASLEKSAAQGFVPAERRLRPENAFPRLL